MRRRRQDGQPSPHYSKGMDRMERILGFALLLAACGIVALIASRKGRSGAVFFFAPALSAMPIASIVTLISGGSSLAVGLAVLSCPLVALVVALRGTGGQEQKVETGGGQ